MQNVTRFVVKPIAFLSVLFLTFLGMQAQKKKAIVYDTIKVGDQVWMRKNLDVDKFRNGTKIPQARTREEWVKAGIMKKPAWCYMYNDPVIGMKMGKLYNWYAVNDKRGLAPKGWSIPTVEDWALLKEEATKEKKRPLQSVSDFWKSDITEDEIEDYIEDEYEEDNVKENKREQKEKERKQKEKERKLLMARKNSLFFAEPSGKRIFLDNEETDEESDSYTDRNGFGQFGDLAKWWSSSEDDNDIAWTYSVGKFSLDDIIVGNRQMNHKASGYSVRCIIK